MENNKPLQYFRIYTSEVFAEIFGMTDEQQALYLRTMLIAWSQKDIEKMRPWMVAQLDNIAHKSEVNRKSALARWNEREAKVEPQPPKKPQERQKKEPIDTADFERFWASYPKRVDKKGALRSWQKEMPDIDLVIRAIESQKANWTDPQFIPMPTTWLNQRRFEAQIDAISKPPEEEEDRITMWKRHFGMPL